MPITKGDILMERGIYIPVNPDTFRRIRVIPFTSEWIINPSSIKKNINNKNKLN